MKVWVVLQKDRHVDPDIWVCATQEQAMQFARETAKEYSNRYGTQITEQTCGIPGTRGWCFTIDYSGESGRLSVIERDITLKCSAILAKEQAHD